MSYRACDKYNLCNKNVPSNQEKLDSAKELLNIAIKTVETEDDRKKNYRK